MEKPFTVRYREFTDNLLNLINSSNIPAILIIQVLAEYQAQLQKIATTQYESDLKTYNDSQEKQND